MQSNLLCPIRFFCIVGVLCALGISTDSFDARAQAETCGSYLHTAADLSVSVAVETARDEIPADFPAPICNGPRCQNAPYRQIPQLPTVPTASSEPDKAATQDHFTSAAIENGFEKALETDASPIQAIRNRLDRPPR